MFTIHTWICITNVSSQLIYDGLSFFHETSFIKHAKTQEPRRYIATCSLMGLASVQRYPAIGEEQYCTLEKCRWQPGPSMFALKWNQWAFLKELSLHYIVSNFLVGIWQNLSFTSLILQFEFSAYVRSIRCHFILIQLDERKRLNCH